MFMATAADFALAVEEAEAVEEPEVVAAPPATVEDIPDAVLEAADEEDEEDEEVVEAVDAFFAPQTRLWQAVWPSRSLG